MHMHADENFSIDSMKIGAFSSYLKHSLDWLSEKSEFEHLESQSKHALTI